MDNPMTTLQELKDMHELLKDENYYDHAHYAFKLRRCILLVTELLEKHELAEKNYEAQRDVVSSATFKDQIAELRKEIKDGIKHTEGCKGKKGSKGK